MEIEIPDLNDIEFEETCRHCWGSKKYETWVPLERERDASGRLKPERYGQVMTPCNECDERGMVLTKAGETLLAFLKKRGFNI